MKTKVIGAYQFAVTGNIEDNFKIIKNAVKEAVEKGVRLLVFPECSLTGYPPRDINCSSDVDFNKLEIVYEQLQELVDNNDICLVVGTIRQEEDRYKNCAIILRPNREKCFYDKRALWGWDKDNFSKGNENGIFEVGDWKVGVRICFEVRFPEFFRELYDEKTDLNIILFYDVADTDDMERYDLIKAHIRTRAVENVTYTLTVDAIYPYQTAPTALYDKSGHALAELKRNEEKMLIYDLLDAPHDFGENGRSEISDCLRDIKLSDS